MLGGDLLKQIKASLYAGRAHRGQVRKFSGDAYIKHPRRIMKRIKKFGIKDPDILAAALLHDTIEDTHVTYNDIKREFGKDVADWVKHLSNPSSAEKAAHIKHTIETAPYEVVLIKTFDRIDNLSDGGSKKFFDKYRETSDIIRDGLKKRGFKKLYNEYMKTYSKIYGNEDDTA